MKYEDMLATDEKEKIFTGMAFEVRPVIYLLIIATEIFLQLNDISVQPELRGHYPPHCSFSDHFLVVQG